MPQDEIIEIAIKYGVKDGIYVTFDLTHDGSLLRFAKLIQSQPTSQEYCCIDSWENAKAKAWNNRDLKLCKCGINESCSHCYPSDFKDGGKWDLCKPMKASKL